jgi:hypothetical protein
LHRNHFLGPLFTRRSGLGFSKAFRNELAPPAARKSRLSYDDCPYAT